MKIVTVRYGIGYGTHDMDLEFDDDMSDDEIEEAVMNAVQERLHYSWAIEGDSDDA